MFISSSGVNIKGRNCIVKCRLVCWKSGLLSSYQSSQSFSFSFPFSSSEVSPFFVEFVSHTIVQGVNIIQIW